MLLSLGAVVASSTRAGAGCGMPAPSAKAEKTWAVLTGGREYPGVRFGKHETCGRCDEEAAEGLLGAMNVTRISPTDRNDFYETMLIGTDGSCRFSDGMEVGALHNPAPVSRCSRGMLYVDQVSAKELHVLYPELQDNTLQDAQMLDDANTLSKVQTASRGFMIASHVIEHMPRTLAAIEAWLRVLRPSGLALITAPFKCVTFDEWRPVTEWKHFAHDHREEASPTRVDRMWHEHLPEWVLSHLAAVAPGAPGGDTTTLVQYNRTFESFRHQLLSGEFKQRGGMHFHTWTKRSWAAFWRNAQQALTQPFAVTHIGYHGMDMYAVLQKMQ